MLASSPSFHPITPASQPQHSTASTPILHAQCRPPPGTQDLYQAGFACQGAGNRRGKRRRTRALGPDQPGGRRGRPRSDGESFPGTERCNKRTPKSRTVSPAPLTLDNHLGDGEGVPLKSVSGKPSKTRNPFLQRRVRAEASTGKRRCWAVSWPWRGPHHHLGTPSYHLEKSPRALC